MAASSHDDATSEAPGEALAGQDAEFDLGLTEDDVRALDAEASEVVAPARAEEEDFDLGLTEDDIRALEAEGSEAVAPELAEEEDFDLGLTADDVRALDAGTLQPAAAVEAAPAFDADSDAAMADIDMDFGDALASEPTAPVGDALEAAQDETAEADLHLFDEADFRLEDDAENEPAAIVEPEPQPEIDESAFSFGEDEFRLDDDAHPVEQQAAEPATDDFSFDDVDLAAEDFAAEPEAAEPEPVEAYSSVSEASVEEPEAAAEPDLAGEAEPPRFEFSVPRYEPRTLPTSPMDVAAEEFRQREAAVAPAGPEFNLEDELNALLGNIRANQAAAAPEPVSPPVEEQPAEQPDTSAAYEASHPPAYEPPNFRPEPVSFDPPEHPADIEDDLNWDLDDAVAAEAGLQQIEEDQAPVYADDDQPEAYAEDEQYDAYAEASQPEGAYARAGQPEDVYAQDLDAEDDLASLDLDDLSFELAAEENPSTQHGDALAGAAVGAAASRFGSAFASRPFETGAPARPSDMQRAAAGGRFAERLQPPAPSGPDSFSPHRDPVVRGNPLKEDPLDVIAQLAEKYSKKEPAAPYGQAMGVSRGSTAFSGESAEDEDLDISEAFEEQPDVETIEVADRAVALADDLDIPELAEEEDLPPVSDYDDLDAEFSSLLSDMNAEPRAAQPAAGQSGTYASFEMAADPGAPRQAPPARKAYDDDPEPDSFALDADDLPGSHVPSGGQYAADDYDYDPDMDQEIAPQHLAAENGRQQKSRGLLLAGLVGGVALIGAIGAFAYSSGGSGGDAPALVRADDGPVKVKPENPGGATVPNQDNKVYETVAGEGAVDAPQQEKLVTTAEEPVDVTPPPPAMEEGVAAAPSGKSEDRIEQILEEAENQTDDEIAAVTPRKVRTMVVKPDGTLMPREDEPGADPSDEQTDTVAAAVPEAGPAPAIPESTGALPATQDNAPAPVPAPALVAPEEAAAPPPAQQEALPPAQEQVAAAEPASEDPASKERGAMPDTAPIAPLRPADQPIDVVGEVKPDQVASATTAAAPGGNWAMQIASQPSEAAAQSSYQDLARRYGGVLEGKEVSIVKAEIAGKGTFWRVRVPAATRNEAISLCENYKAAGGNCFVSR